MKKEMDEKHSCRQRQKDVRKAKVGAEEDLLQYSASGSRCDICKYGNEEKGVTFHRILIVMLHKFPLVQALASYAPSRVESPL